MTSSIKPEQLAAIERLIVMCEGRPLGSQDRAIVDRAREELEAHRSVSRLLRRYSASARRRAAGGT